ncbi:urease accessory protein UreD [Corticibacterium sp. UT-5YL-CI-8]|nr:urease accessory protein UreD [Tianweitania sp. UT-5YL-CI-8]
MTLISADRSGFSAAAKVGLPLSFDAPTSWDAELALGFERSHGATRLMRRHHRGPLMVQRPFHPENDGTCHVYVLHPPGGVAGGDRLDLRFTIAADARCVLTTPGAAKFYRSGTRASQCNTVKVASGGVCEYLPQETIVFSGAQAELETQVSLDGDASYIGWDIVCLGRPAANEAFDSGSLTQRIEIVRDGRPIWFERIRLDGGSPVLAAPYALAGQTVFGTMICASTGLDDAIADQVRAAVGQIKDGLFSVSRLDDVLVCRYLGPQAAIAKALFVRAWDAMRRALQDKPSCPPRIWAT